MVTITAPGVEINEVDLSFYDFPQPREETQNVLIPGFAAKGLNNIPYEFTNDNTDDDLLDTFGTPTNEAERYFFNACSEAIKRENVVLYAVRLPYANTSTQKYNCVKYKLGTTLYTPAALNLNGIVSADATFRAGALMKIEECELTSIDKNEFEYSIRQGNTKLDENEFIIADKTQDVYGKIPVDADHMELSTRYVLGILPIVTTAANALYFQNLIAVDDDVLLPNYEAVGSVSSTTTILQPNMMVYPPNSSTLSDNDKSAMTLSRFAANFFPTIDMNADGSFDRSRMKNIGVVVFKGYVDAEYGNKVKYEPVEAFAGSLKRDDVDPVTGASRFIDDIINTNSKTIEFYSNCFNRSFEAQLGSTGSTSTIQDLAEATLLIAREAGIPVDANSLNSSDAIYNFISQHEAEFEALGTNDDGIDLKAQYESIRRFLNNIHDADVSYSDIDMLYVNNLNAGILGFEEIAAEDKRISYTEIIQSLETISKQFFNVNQKQIDLIVDAGVSNIAQFMYMVNSKIDITEDTEENASTWCFTYDPIACKKFGDIERSAAEAWKFYVGSPGSTASVPLDGATDKWREVLNKYDQLCKKRKDCMFLSDGLRPLCIKGNYKLVSQTNPNATVENTINPFIKYMTGKIDTSYGAGYCDWYRIVDPTSKVNIWMPPSVKAMCVILDTTNKKNYWSVPAGVNNGRLNSSESRSTVVVNDIAFNPTVQEAGSIYTKSWNYCMFYQDDGFVLEGQRTFQARPTAFDRINVRRLFLYLERKVFNAAKYFVFEPNTAYTRQRLVDVVTPYFQAAKINGGITDYKIICDETNNTPETIDRNELHVKIAIKPAKSIEFIEVTFFALRTNASFSEAGI